MNEYYAIDKKTQTIAYKSASLFLLKNTIAYDERDESEFIFTGDINMKYLSRIVYVDGDCIYNNKNFWTKTAPTIIEEFDEHEVLDFMGKPVDQVRFETEFNSNSSRISNIDGVAGEVDYNMTIGNEFISLFREECIFTDFKDISPLEIGQKLINVIAFVETGSFREAKMLLKMVEPDVFLTEERLQKYEDMLDAADAITYATDETFFYTAEEDHGDTPVYTQVYGLTDLDDTDANMSKEHSVYYVPGHMVDGDKLILVLRHADRGDDSSDTGDITDTGVNRATIIGSRMVYSVDPSSGRSTNILSNDAHYFSTEITRAKHTAQAIAAGRNDTMYSASDYSGITVDQDLLEGYRFFKESKKPENISSASTVLKKYCSDPSTLTSDELANCFGVNTAEEAVAKLAADTAKITAEIISKADRTLNVFITHDYFIGPYFCGITNRKYYGNTSGTWINYCSGVAIILHKDNTYDAFPVKAEKTST